MNTAHQVHAGYHNYGYWIEQTIEGGHVIKREEYGNSSFNSTSLHSLTEGQALPLEKIKSLTEQQANTLAHTLGIDSSDIQIFHDKELEAQFLAFFDSKIPT